MRFRKLGGVNLEASVVALGAWPIGGGPWWGPTDDEESIRAIHAGLDAGVNLIDTAPVYGFGHSEQVVGKAIKDRRDKVIVATKCGLWWADETGTPFFEQMGKTVRRSLEPRTIRIEVEESLRRLRTDYVDLLQTHWQAVEPFKTPIAETMGCLLDLKREGKIRAIGVSNAVPSQIDEYRRSGPVDTSHPRYSMLDRRIERDLLPYCADNGIATLAYSPLEQGLLTGRIGMDRQLSPDEYRSPLPWYAPQNRRRVLDMLARWHALTDHYGCSLAQQVSDWPVAQSGVTVALCGER